MGIELFRDVVIIVAGIVVILVAVFLAVISYLVYRRINGVLKSARTTAAAVEALTIVSVDKIGKPLIKAAGIIEGITLGIRAIRRVFRKGG